MAPRTVNAGNGWQWIVEGFGLFCRATPMWIALTVLLTLVWIVSFLVPIVGPLLFNLFAPVLFAGWLLGCRAIERGEPLRMRHFAAGFENRFASLVTVGGVHLAGAIIIIGLFIAVVGMSVFSTIRLGKPLDLDASMALARQMLIGLAIALVLYTPLVMAVWFAPLLIVFDELGAADAMKQSFAACMKNMTPFLVYGLALTVLTVLASLPLLLGWFVLTPVVVCSVYVSYREIFHPAASA